MLDLLYFAYGSNMDQGQMYNRCPGSEFHSPAVLPDHLLCFPRLSGARWDYKAVAGINKSEGDQVQGVVYRVSHQHLRALDGFEGVDQDHYKRQTVQVIQGETVYQAETYYAIPQGDGNFLPSKKYMDALLKGASEAGLSEGYLKQLYHWQNKAL